MAKNKSPDSAVTMSGASARIVDNATFSVPRGTMAALVGPSGSGKTTLMRMIVGTQAKVTGDVQVLGLPAGHPDLRRRVTYATQAASIFEDLTVKENLDYIRRIYGLSPQEQDSIVESLNCRNTRIAFADNLAVVSAAE